MGIWSTLLVFEVYSTYSRLGIINGMNRELPYALGKGEESEAKSLASTALFFTHVNTIIIVLIASVIYSFVKPHRDYTFAIIILILRIASNSYGTYISGTFRSNDNFNTLSNIQFAIIGLRIISCPLILFGFTGFLIWELILSVAHTLFLHIYRPIKVKPTFNYTSFRNMIAIGFPIFIISTLISTVDTFPRLFIIKWGTETDLGIYSPVYFMISTISLLPNQLTSYFYPKFSFELAKTNSVVSVKKSLIKIILVSSFSILILAIGIYLVSDKVILLFPKYRDSLPYLQVSLLAAPFVMFRLAHTMSAVFKNFKTMILFVTAYFLVQSMTLIILKSFSERIVEVAVVSQIISYVILSLVSFFLMSVIFKDFNKKNNIEIESDC